MSGGRSHHERTTFARKPLECQRKEVYRQPRENSALKKKQTPDIAEGTRTEGIP